VLAGESDYIFQNQGDGTFRKLKEEVGLKGYDFGLGCVWSQNHYDQKVNMGSMGDAAWFLERGAPRQFMKNCLFLNSGNQVPLGAKSHLPAMEVMPAELNYVPEVAIYLNP